VEASKHLYLQGSYDKFNITKEQNRGDEYRHPFQLSQV
jgi:hypothetical protein